jgi:hypothetical protein
MRLELGLLQWLRVAARGADISNVASIFLVPTSSASLFRRRYKDYYFCPRSSHKHIVDYFTRA